MDTDTLARKIWDYHQLHQQLQKADCIIVLGSHDTRVAARGAELFLAGWAPLLLFSGNLGTLTSAIWDRPEAEIFAEIAISMGVPPDRILIENQATHTGENVQYSRQLLQARGIIPRKIIAVQKPYMERRTDATFKKVWPEPELIVTSPRLGYESYPAGAITREKIIHIMVGDLQRILLYPAKGYQIPQEVPADVLEAYQRLVEMGYTGHLIKD